MNVSLPNKEQWRKILTAVIFSFGSGFLATFIAQGGIQVGWGWEPIIALLGGALVSGINGAIYTLYITLFKES